MLPIPSTDYLVKDISLDISNSPEYYYPDFACSGLFLSK